MAPLFTGLKFGFGSNLAGGGEPSVIDASGGSITTFGSYTVHTFTHPTSDNFVVATGKNNVEYLVVAGGGTGSAQYGGGGGAGGLRTNLSGHPLAGSSFEVEPGTYPITVGAGGVYVTPSGMPGVAGNNSVFGPIVSTGGGGGGHPGEQPAPWGTGTNGGPGGSGGGGAGRAGAHAPNLLGGAGNAGGFSPPEGNAGGLGKFPGSSRMGAGGGGAGAVGQDGQPGDAGNGGIGVQVLIAPPVSIGAPGPGGTHYFGGGGGGGSFNAPTGSGGAGGGGAGGSAGSPGTNHTGGGGGGGQHPGATVGGNGGPGVVVVRYLTNG